MLNYTALHYTPTFFTRKNSSRSCSSISEVMYFMISSILVIITMITLSSSIIIIISMIIISSILSMNTSSTNNFTIMSNDDYDYLLRDVLDPRRGFGFYNLCR